MVAAAGATEEALVPIYFGVGCFWHVQHEFIEAEKALLGRGPETFTALAGYAGGRATGRDPTRPDNKAGTVCYHNFQV